MIVEQLSLFEPQPIIALRQYQIDVVELAQALIKENPRGRFLFQLPTGMGKTVIFATIIARLGIPTLVIAHREELLQQAKDKIVRCGIPADAVDIVLQSRPNPSALVWVASIQTIVRGARLDQVTPRLLVIDEAHHSSAQTYQDVIKAFPWVPVLGFTATPTRSARKEKEELAKIWGELIYQYPIKKAIIDGYLAQIEYYEVRSEVDLNGIRTVAGDFNQEQLAKRVNVSGRNEACVQKYLDLGGGKCVAFCVDVEHTVAMRDLFRQHGVRSESVVGDTPPDDRRDILRQFERAGMHENFVLSNCNVLTEGFDQPDVRVVLLARPTQSPIVYLQQLGRGTRIADGKNAVIVIDVADNCKNDNVRNCLTTVFNLRPGTHLEGNVIEFLRKQEEAEKTQAVEDAASAVDQIEIVLRRLLFDMPIELERSTLAWYSPDDGKYFCSVDQGKYFLIEDIGLSFVLYGINPNGRKELMRGTDLEAMDHHAATTAQKWFGPTAYMWDKSRRINWGNDAPTERQVEMLAKFAPELDPTKISKATASEVISAHIAKRDQEPATRKQLWFLQSHGVMENGLTKKAANRLIVQIKREALCTQ